MKALNKDKAGDPLDSQNPPSGIDFSTKRKVTADKKSAGRNIADTKSDKRNSADRLFGRRNSADSNNDRRNSADSKSDRRNSADGKNDTRSFIQRMSSRRNSKAPSDNTVEGGADAEGPENGDGRGKEDVDDRRDEEKWDEINESPLQGPMGEAPLHTLFLLSYTTSIPNQAAIHELCKEFVRTFYFKQKISMQYRNNLRFFIDQELLFNASVQEDFRPQTSDQGNKVIPGRFNGTYTGETVLHIAIVNRDTEMAKWLIDRDAKIDAVANGDFFYPSIIRRPRFQALGRDIPWKWKMLAHIQDRKLPQEPVMRVWRNEASAFCSKGSTDHHLCYFGEVPLSFAASMGCVDICEMLWKKSHNEETNKESYNAKFLNYQDSFGNSAMHMAVFHRRKEVFDWLIQHNGKDSLEELNHDGLTPFTLAARLGHVDMYK
mmetsp:Transcript_31859/g.80202  ORF Transcript_31859/g.80202 Transcript_31859/m.80202 type:complete len:433 (-) Transcript_31859:26-1324(-)